MKTRPQTIHRTRGIMMLECLVYMGILVLVMGVATALLYSSWTAAKGIRRNSDDIVTAMHAGDRWRADVRAATGSIRVEAHGDSRSISIPVSGDSIIYTFENGAMHRHSKNASQQLLLANVKSSQFQQDSRANGKAWRWELELNTARKEVRLHPLFTFEAVEGDASK